MSISPTNQSRLLPALLACTVLLMASVPAPAQVLRRIRAVPNQPGMIMLPYNVADNQGNQWMVFQPGVLRMQGNMPVFSQAGQLTINGQMPNMMNNQRILFETFISALVLAQKLKPILAASMLEFGFNPVGLELWK